MQGNVSLRLFRHALPLATPREQGELLVPPPNPPPASITSSSLILASFLVTTRNNARFPLRQVAAELGRLLRPLKGMCHVNIIPLNPTAGYAGGPSMADAVEEFISVLDRFGVPATPR